MTCLVESMVGCPRAYGVLASSILSDSIVVQNLGRVARFSRPISVHKLFNPHAAVCFAFITCSLTYYCPPRQEITEAATRTSSAFVA
jgi:hypothetical protein